MKSTIRSLLTTSLKRNTLHEGRFGNVNCHELVASNTTLSQSTSTPYYISYHHGKQFSTHAPHAITRNPKYKKLQQEDIDYFRSILDSSGVITDKSDIEPYNTDWMQKWSGDATIVLKPSSTEQVSKILAYCHRECIAVVPQGGNTGLVGGSIPIFDEVILNLGRMSKIIDLNHIQGIVTVEAGCILENLNTYLEEHGFITPLDLGAKGSCQIGGNASTAAGGLRYVRYGSLRGTILGIEAVKADGTIIDSLTSLRKDNTGYDIKQLFIGSEGTLGVITKLSLLCPPKPNSVSVAYLAVPTYEAVLQVMGLARKHCMETISATEFQDRYSLDLVLKHLDKTKDPLPSNKANFYVLIEVSGGNEAHNQEKLNTFLEDAYEKVDKLDGIVAESTEQIRSLWKLREGVPEGSSKEGYVFKYDVSLPVRQMYELVEKTKQRVSSVGATVAGYGHLGDGNLHINVMIPRSTDEAAFKKHVEETQRCLEPWIFEQLKLVRGSISAEHGLGQAKNQFIAYSKDQASIDIMYDLKNILDPKGILNPYKFLPTKTTDISQ